MVARSCALLFLVLLGSTQGSDFLEKALPGVVAGSNASEPGDAEELQSLAAGQVEVGRAEDSGMPALHRPRGREGLEKVREEAVKRAESAAQCCLNMRWSCCIPKPPHLVSLAEVEPVNETSKGNVSLQLDGLLAAEGSVDLAELEAANESLEEDAAQQLDGLSATEAGGQHFYAQVCAALNCHRGLPLGQVHSFGEAAVGRARGSCVVAFRGTASMAGVLQDVASGALVPFGCPGCRVGAGFKAGYEAVAGRIRGALHALGCHAVAVTGHSLGAAKAILGMYDLAKSGFHITTSYVFGEPRVGNGAFLASFHATVHAAVFQVTHGLDPIVRLGAPGARHVGRTIYESGHSRLTDHLHYSGVDMTSCMLPVAPGGKSIEKAGEKVARKVESAAHCCLHMRWSCCIPR